MKWIKWYTITCLCIATIIIFLMFIYPNKISAIETTLAYSFVEKKVPKEAKYQGYKKNQIAGTTVLYYSYNNATHLVKLSHPEDNITREINWDKVSDINFD